MFIRICILLDMLVDTTVHQEDQATYLSERVCVDYDGYKKETGDMYRGPHIYFIFKSTLLYDFDM